MKPEFTLDDMRKLSVGDLTAPGGWIETAEDLSMAGNGIGDIAGKLNCTVAAVKYLLFYWERREQVTS
jgi:hypothetical protein